MASVNFSGQNLLFVYISVHSVINLLPLCDANMPLVVAILPPRHNSVCGFACLA